MFEPSKTPRVFALPPGVDFPFRLVQGLISRNDGRPPEDLARVRLIVNTRRMQRRIKSLFDTSGAHLLPRIQLVTDLGDDTPWAAAQERISPLRRRLELARLITRLIERQPQVAPGTAAFDLADSLASLLDEMQGEGVAPDALSKLDVTDSSGHWARSLGFIQIVQDYLKNTPGMDAEAIQRQTVEHLIQSWDRSPPTDPVIVAGSTGSRGTTATLMAAVSRLPQGALVLPGFDFDMPTGAWAGLGDAMTAEDHPQYRYYSIMDALGINRDDIASWDDTPPPSAARNRLVSLALRPAPVTDAWLTEGGDLAPFAPATDTMTLIEAPSPRSEAMTIALGLRQAAENGQVAALITPDRMLTRQVEAALDRWAITADDSAGKPLPLTAPGRFLRHIADLFGKRLTVAGLLTVLKHPLCNTGNDARGLHLLWTRELELGLRRDGPPFPQKPDLIAWAERAKTDDGRHAWAAWLGDLFDGLSDAAPQPLVAYVQALLDLAQTLSAGPNCPGSGALWDQAAGRKAKTVMAELIREAPHGGQMTAREFAALLSSVLAKADVRTPDDVYSNIMIWGTLEARVQGADLVILGGLNDGIWPAAPSPDPWLNRRMRLEAGLLLPERRIGLSAHDFQQAVAAKTVWMTRALRNDEAETVPSRWLNRLINLLGGLKDGGGDQALVDMRQRGQVWLDLAAAMDKGAPAIPPAHRPSPSPPAAARPRSLSVTEVKTLIRDPYAIYAKRVLRLRALDPIRPRPDAPLRGTVLHKVFEDFVRQAPAHGLEQAHGQLMAVADRVLAAEAPWPATHRLWRAKLERVADWFLKGEAQRRTDAAPVAFETRGTMVLTDPPFTLIAKADRIDRAFDGSVDLYDYKTGTPPSEKEQLVFDKQLLLEAAMIGSGAFSDIGPAEVRKAQYIGVGTKPEIRNAPLNDIEQGQIWAEFAMLVTAYLSDQKGFTARRAVAKERFEGDFDHLSRLGEWDTSMAPVREVLT